MLFRSVKNLAYQRPTFSKMKKRQQNHKLNPSATLDGSAVRVKLPPLDTMMSVDPTQFEVTQELNDEDILQVNWFRFCFVVVYELLVFT